MAQNLENFINKYNTPRIFQIFSTISYIALSVLMFRLNVFGKRDPFSLYGSTRYIKVFEIFRWNFNYDVQQSVRIIVVVAAIVGIIFVWLNRPKTSGICSGVLAGIMLLSLLRMYDFEDYYVIEGYYGTDFYVMSVEDTYYILWGALVLLMVFIALSIIFTKEGARQQKVVALVETISQTSSADELQKYKELLDQGIISEDEFQQQKAKILSI